MNVQKGIFAEATPEKRAGLVELVRRFGGSTADAVLHPTMHFYETPDVQGFVGYRKAKNCVFIFGDPICSPDDRPKLAVDFHRFADEQKFRVMYISASQDYAHWAIENVCGAIIEFGIELIFNSPTDPRKITGAHGSLVRQKSKHASKEDVTVQEYIPHDASIEAGVEEAKELWLGGRHGPQVHSSDVYLFLDRYGKRWFYAKKGDQFIGVIVLNHIQSRKGWLINHLMVIPDAPHGVSELLISTVFETLEKEGCPFATVGAIASSRLGEVRGLNKIAKFVAHTVFRLASKINNLQRLNNFWDKFQPDSTPSYLLFSQKWIGIRDLICLKNVIGGSQKGVKRGKSEDKVS